MSFQQAGHPRSLANGYGRHRVEKETVARSEHKSQSGRTSSTKLTTAGVADSIAGYESSSHERLVYLSTCLIGHSVDVQVKDGSVFSGIFHATNADKDLGIVLKMAREIKTSSSRGQKPFLDSFNKAPLRTFIIPYKELVQMTAKDVSVTREGFENDLQRVKEQEIMLDSVISQNRYVDAERELGRWVPDEDDPQCPELDNIFDGPWNRGWDQFEANATLFGVKSTFDEDLYTTKLERGPQMRELEREATRIAREIEGEETQDLHLAEERGAQFPEHFDIDEETKYSSVFRGVDDSGYDEDEDILLDSQNNETFGDTSSSVLKKPYANLTIEKANVEAQVPSCSSSKEEKQFSMRRTAGDTHRSDSSDNSKHFSSRSLSDSSAAGNERRIQENQFNERHGGSKFVDEVGEKIASSEEAQTSKSKDLPSSLAPSIGGSDIAGASLNKAQEKNSPPSDRTGKAAIVKAQGPTSLAKTRGRPGSSASSTSESGHIASAINGPTLSPSSSLGSISSEKSTLNPHAKEFKFNPNAKSFVPSQTPMRPVSPVSDGSFYFPPNLPAIPHMHGMPVGVGVGPSYSPQSVIYNPQVSHIQSPQGYYHPNGPQYGQQMILGHPRQVLYMPAYSPEMQYK